MTEKGLKNVTASLLQATDATFRSRQTSFPPEEVEAFTPAFVDGHAVQWNAFAKKVGASDLVDGFGAIVEYLKAFAGPMLRALACGERFKKRWKAGQGWVAD